MVSPRRNFSLFYNLWSDLAGCSHCLTPRCKSDPLACAWTGCLPRWTRAKSLHSLLRPQSYGALVPLQDCNLSPHPGWRAKLVPICSLQSYSGQSHAGMVTVTPGPQGMISTVTRSLKAGKPPSTLKATALHWKVEEKVLCSEVLQWQSPKRNRVWGFYTELWKSFTYTLRSSDG